MEDEVSQLAHVRSIAETFQSYPIQSALDIATRTKLPLPVVENILCELVKCGVVMESEIEYNVKIFRTIKTSNPEFDQFRELLAPFQGVDTETLTKAKNEAHRIEKAILIVKTQVENHPLLRTKEAESVRRVLSQVELHEAEAAIKKIEHDIGKYLSVTKLLLKDVAEIKGISERELLLKLNASRSLQHIIL